VAVADILEKEGLGHRRPSHLATATFPVRLDVADRASIDAMVEQVAATAGRIDVLVTMRPYSTWRRFLEITEESYDKQFAINVKGLLSRCRRWRREW